MAKNDPAPRCQLIGGEKLAAESGLGPSICGQVQRAIAAKAPNAHYTVGIQVLSRSRLSAKLIVNGHVLPLQNFAVMDRNLSKDTIEHFADSLAAAVVSAAKS